MTELYSDASSRLLPISRAEATAMVNELRSAPLLFGYRGRPVGDVDALVELMLQVAELSQSFHGAEVALELNPVGVLPNGKGVIILDALLVRGSTDGRSREGQ
jgi:acetyltransferase